MAVDPKGSGKFVSTLDKNFRAIATGSDAGPAKADQATAIKQHVAALKRLGAKSR